MQFCMAFDYAVAFLLYIVTLACLLASFFARLVETALPRQVSDAA